MMNILNKIEDQNFLNLFQKVSENIDELIIILNEKYEIEYINPITYTNLTGIDGNTLIGTSALDIFHPGDLTKGKNYLKTILKLSEIKGDIRLKTMKKDVLWVQIKGLKIFDDNQKVKILLIFKDILKSTRGEKQKSEERFREMCDNLTEIRFWKFLQPKQAIAAYQESQEMLKLVMNSIPQYIAWKDKYLSYMGCNNNFAKIAGLHNQDEIIGKTNDDLNWNEEIIKILNENDLRVLESGISKYNNIESWLKINDKQIWLNTNRIILYDLEGNKTGILLTSEDITERKLFEETLKESEEKFRDLAHLLPDAIYELNQDFIITYANSRALEKFGYTQEEVNRGIHVSQLLIPEQLKMGYENIKDMLKGEEPNPHEYIMKKKDGTPFYVLSHSRPIYKKGEVIGVRGVIHDITERKIAEQKLKESEEKYRTIFSASPDFIYITDYNGNILDANQAMLNSLGAKLEDIYMKNVLDFYAGTKVNDVKAVINQIQSGTEVEGIVVESWNSKGEVLEFEINAVPLKENNKIVKILNFARNITERKKAEYKLKESETKYRHLFDNAPFVIWVFNSNGILLECNVTTNKIFQVYKREDLIGKSIVEILKLIMLKSNIKYIDIINTLLERFKRLKRGERLEPKEYEVIREDGSKIWVTLDASIVNIGNETLIQVFLKDMTDAKEAELKIKESEEQLKKLNLELEQKVLERTKELAESEEKLKIQNIELKNLDKLKDEFITVAAHELKTPLISISGYTDYILMKHKDILNPEITEDLLIVQRNIDRLQKLMNQLLEVMKIDSKQMELNKGITGINQIIKNCLEELSYLIKEKNHKIILNMEENLEINLDSERIFQVISNLISNAIKYTPENGTIEISAKKDPNNNHYIFNVKDNGIGLTHDELEILFKKFAMVKQLDEEYYKKGTGLGLYISKGIIQAHGGKIWATSEGPNKGTSFFFTIPI